jgi:hypothetical protein
LNTDTPSITAPFEEETKGRHEAMILGLAPVHPRLHQIITCLICLMP